MNTGSVLITGPTSGIGRDLAHLFAKDGKNLILVSRNKTRLHDLKRELEEKYGIEAQVLVKDLSLPGSADELIDECTKRKFTVQSLVNNAGFGVFGSFPGKDIKHQVRMVELHFTSLITLTSAFLPEMIRRKSGGVLNVASTAGFKPLPFLNVYASTKAAVVHFSTALAEEVRGTGVRVTCVCPGPTKTEFGSTDLMNKEFATRFPRMSSMKVAEMSYKAFMKGKVLCITGVTNQIMIGIASHLPSSFVTRLSRKVIEQKHPKIAHLLL